MKLEDMTKEQLIEQCKKLECCGNCEGSEMSWHGKYGCENSGSEYYCTEVAPEHRCDEWELWEADKEG